MRNELVKIALAWQNKFGVAPSVTSAVSEYDAAMLVGMSEKEYSDFMQCRTAVSKGSDFEFEGKKYQVKANRPSGKKGSLVTRVPKARNYEWDILIWILYNESYEIQEVWQWDKNDYKKEFENRKRLSPKDYRMGKGVRLFPN